MTFRNKYLFIIFSVICLAGLIQQLIRYYNKEEIYESPKQLSGENQVIVVNYTMRPCICPMWKKIEKIETKKSTDNNFFYLEPATLDLPKLEGKFYYGKGIPDYYENHNEEPEKANIFHYTEFEIIKPEATR